MRRIIAVVLTIMGFGGNVVAQDIPSIEELEHMERRQQAVRDGDTVYFIRQGQIMFFDADAFESGGSTNAFSPLVPSAKSLVMYRNHVVFLAESGDIYYYDKSHENWRGAGEAWIFNTQILATDGELLALSRDGVLRVIRGNVDSPYAKLQEIAVVMVKNMIRDENGEIRLVFQDDSQVGYSEFEVFPGGEETNFAVGTFPQGRLKCRFADDSVYEITEILVYKGSGDLFAVFQYKINRLFLSYFTKV